MVFEKKMNRVVSTILIPLLLVSQSLFSVPHSHAETSVVEPDGHAARPHVHFHHHDSDHHHHGHHDGDESPSSPNEQTPGHDSDAVYAGDIQLLNDGKVAKVTKAKLSVMSMVCNESATVAALRFRTRLSFQHSSQPVLRPNCALFLQQLSILC